MEIGRRGPGNLRLVDIFPAVRYRKPWRGGCDDPDEFSRILKGSLRLQFLALQGWTTSRRRPFDRFHVNKLRLFPSSKAPRHVFGSPCNADWAHIHSPRIELMSVNPVGEIRSETSVFATYTAAAYMLTKLGICAMNDTEMGELREAKILNKC